ncbi:MAG: hypothetical protein NTX25_06675 [Proteobacteria bacterium]|nr:hypothetical protein [Pseudomonadota bacterium]
MDFDSLFAKRSTLIKPGLQRIERSYNFLGQPAKSIPAVLIAGTNGKGSTSGFLWCLLALNKIQVGLYSSPHLVAFSERCQLSEKFCSDAELALYFRKLQELLPSDYYEELSFFEIASLLAFQVFEAMKAEFQVLEVGLGGRWDATNVSDPLVSAVVSLSLDHQDYLGSDLLSILDEKLGVMRATRPLFWGNTGEICQVPGYRQVIERRAQELQCPLFIAGESFEYDAKRQVMCLRLSGIEPLDLPIEGVVAKAPEFLLRNLAIAAAMYQYLADKRLGPNLLPLVKIWPLLCSGMGPAPVTLFGRSQRLKIPSMRGERRVILDVCHNPDGAATFLTGLESQNLPGPMPALVSILQDKDRDGILDCLRSKFDPVILFGIDHERAWQAEHLAERHQDLPFFKDFASAWQFALQSWEPGLQPWAICGSVLAVGRVLQYFGCAPQDGIRLERILCGDW